MGSRMQDILRRERMESTIPSLITLFAATKASEGKSENTVSWYRRRLSAFSEFLGEVPKITEFTLPNARAFVSSLQERSIRYEKHPYTKTQEGGLSAFYIHSYVRAIKAFGAWLFDEGFTTSNVMTRLKRPQLPKPMIEILTDEEINRLFNSLNTNTFLGLRMMCLLLLLYDTGIRASELIGIKLEDIDWQNDTIKVWGKGNKQREVAFDPQTRKYLLRYVNAFRSEPANPNSKEVFLSTKGEPLTYCAMAHLIKRAGESVGIPRLHPHLSRHSFAVKYLVAGGDLIALKLILGHTDIATTQIYLHLAQAQVNVRKQRFSPVSQIKIRARKSKAAQSGQ
jgi:site-specific recombinase XerD